MPIITYIYGYQIYIWSNENNEPIHFHVAKGKRGANNTKFWILSKGEVVLDKHNSSRYNRRDMMKIERHMNTHLALVQSIVQEWKRRQGYIQFIQ